MRENCKRLNFCRKFYLWICPYLESLFENYVKAQRQFKGKKTTFAKTMPVHNQKKLPLQRQFKGKGTPLQRQNLLPVHRHYLCKGTKMANSQRLPLPSCLCNNSAMHHVAHKTILPQKITLKKAHPHCE